MKTPTTPACPSNRPIKRRNPILDGGWDDLDDEHAVADFLEISDRIDRVRVEDNDW